MRRITAIVVTGLLLAGCSTGDDGDDGDTADPESTDAERAATGPTLGPLVSGTASVVDGTFVWTDYVYDDRGADTEPGTRTDIDAAGGDATYGSGWRNEADIVQTQLGLDAEGRVTVRIVLETLTDPSVPVIVLGFDTDGDPTTGTDVFGDDWSPPGPIGAEHFAFLREEGSELQSGTETDTIETTELDVTVDPEANTIDATLPLDPEGATWNVLAVAATEPETAVDPTLYLHDLGFVGSEPEYRWQDDIQADLLAGDGDVADASAEVDFGVLAEGGTELADATTPGFHTYLYESDAGPGRGRRPAPRRNGLEYRGPVPAVPRLDPRRRCRARASR